jgi:hypothetical protein
MAPKAAPTSEHSVATVCPLDCPDACSLDVTVQEGKVTVIDGSSANPVTGGYICAKVRRFPERMYGPDRVLHPAVRKGPKGSGWFEQVSWDDALGRIADRLRAVRDEFGGEAILPYSYGGSNGLLTQDTSDATLFRRLGTSRLARTVCAAATGAANQSLYGKMPSVVYQDLPEARLIILWGVVGLVHRPCLRDARSAARSGGRSPHHAAGQTGRPAPGGAPSWTSRWRCRSPLPVQNGHADQTLYRRRNATGCATRARWTFAARPAGSVAAADSTPRRVVEASPAWSVRLGPGTESQRRLVVDGDPGVPAVAGKFGVRGGGYAMSNSNAWGIERTSSRGSPTRLVNMNQLGRALTSTVRR